jgi:hypothetical protein
MNSDRDVVTTTRRDVSSLRESAAQTKSRETRGGVLSEYLG